MRKPLLHCAKQFDLFLFSYKNTCNINKNSKFATISNNHLVIMTQMKMSTDINESNSDMSDSEEIEDENLSEVDNDVEDDRVIDSDEEVNYNCLIFNRNQGID